MSVIAACAISKGRTGIGKDGGRIGYIKAKVEDDSKDRGWQSYIDKILSASRLSYTPGARIDLPIQGLLVGFKPTLAST
jgi:hypothetical protein